MLRRQLTVFLGFLVIGGGLCYGLMQLFALRMGTGGDAHPEYSTLRADPLGAEALYDSLNEVPGLSAWRNYQPLPHLSTSNSIALVYLGLGREARWEEKELKHFELMIGSGSRAIMAFSPVSAIDPVAERRRQDEKEKERKKKESDARKAGKTREEIEKMLEEGPGIPFSTVAAKWGFRFAVTRRPRNTPAPHFQALAQAAAYGLEPMVPWHSELHFADVRAPWKTLYTVAGQPVLIERTWGAGSLVLAADTYFLSNEGLRDEGRPPMLLAQLLGSQRSIVFDEEHLGVAEQSGISTLARKYRLHGFIAGLILLAALFIWQNIVRFVPPQEEELAAAALVAGRGSNEGFLALLRRSVPAGRLLDTCVAEWRRTYTGDSRALDRQRAIFHEKTEARKEPEMVAAYAAVVQAVGGKK